MRRHWRGPVLAVLQTLALATAVGSEAAAAASDPGAASAGQVRTVILELFTSQGCSSCLPADRLLATLAGRRRVGSQAVEVVPLAFHVDYWDGIGWPDPFASAEWSARQRAYAAHFGDRRIYTPQLVAAGRRHCVGSNTAEVASLIAWAAQQKPRVRLSVETVSGDGKGFDLAVEAQVLAGLEERPKLMAAVFDGGHITAVSRGENAHHTLRNERVVRRLETLRSLDTAAGVQRAAWRVDLDPAWHRATLGVAVFAQATGTGAIVGAAWHALGANAAHAPSAASEPPNREWP